MVRRALTVLLVAAALVVPQAAFAADEDPFMWADPEGDPWESVSQSRVDHPPADILASVAYLPTSGEAYFAMQLGDWFPSSFVGTWVLTADPDSDESVFEFSIHAQFRGATPFATAHETRYGSFGTLSCGPEAEVLESEAIAAVFFDTSCLPDVPLHIRTETWSYNGKAQEDWSPDPNFESTGYGWTELSSYNWTGPIIKTAPAPEPEPTSPTPTARDYSDVCAGAGSVTFNDVGQSGHTPAIRCVAGYGIAHGTGGGRFSPGGTLTKGQTASFLMRLLEVADFSVTPGADYCRGSGGVHEANFEALMGAGVIPLGACDTGARITRAEMAAWTLAVIDGAGVPPADLADADFYPDDDRHPLEAALNGLTAHGVVTGKTDGTFGPDETLTRAQMATFLARTLDVIAS